MEAFSLSLGHLIEKLGSGHEDETDFGDGDWMGEDFQRSHWTDRSPSSDLVPTCLSLRLSSAAFGTPFFAMLLKYLHA